MNWASHVAPLLLTVALWWGSTALIARLIVGHPQHYSRLLQWFTLIGLAGLGGIVLLREVTTSGSAMASLVAALAVWSWIEVTFLTGRITGVAARTAPATAPPSAGTLARATAAIAAILWHELLIIATVGVVALGTLGGANQLALLVILLLWLMRSSAKLNLFLGVRNLGAGFLPPHLRHLLEFMRQRRMNLLMPVSLLLGSALCVHFAWLAATALSAHEAAAAAILATLAALATLEHLLMILPVPAEALWRWSLAPRQSSR